MPPTRTLLRFLVRVVIAAALAVFLDLHPVGMRPPVLGRRVVAPLAIGAREGDDVAHDLVRDLRDDAGAHRPPPLPDREPQLLLHRHRLDQLDRHRHASPPPHPSHPPTRRCRPTQQPRPDVATTATPDKTPDTRAPPVAR